MALLASVDDGIAVPSDVEDVDSVIGVPPAVEMVSELDVVVTDGRPVTMVVCLVIVTIELFGIVWVIPESVMTADSFEVAAGRDEVVGVGVA